MQRSILDFFSKPSNSLNENIKTVEPKDDKIVASESEAKINSHIENDLDELDDVIIKPKKFKRIRVISDDYFSDIENSTNRPIKKKPKSIKNILSEENNETSYSSPIKQKEVIPTKPITPSTRKFLSSFQSKSTESEPIVSDATKSIEEHKTSELYDHMTFEFLKKENIMDSKKRRPQHPDYDTTTLNVPNDFMSKLTPAMRQWWILKATGMFDTLLFFKVGKFYELYHMDAVVAVNELGISYMRGNYAHCGFPEIAFSKMSDQLVQKGYKVARVEQTETVDAMTARCQKTATKDKVVKREICQIVTPGTRTFSLRNSSVKQTTGDEGDDMTFDDDVGATLYALKEVPIDNAFRNKSRLIMRIGVAAVNTTTGRFMLTQFDDDNQRSKLRTMISRYPPNEIIYQKGDLSKETNFLLNTTLSAIKKEGLMQNTQFLSSDDALEQLLESEYFIDTPRDRLSQFGLPIGLNEVLNEGDNLGRSANPRYELAVNSLGALIYYLRKCLIDKYLISMANVWVYHPSDEIVTTLSHSTSSEPFYSFQSNMILDSNALINLDLLRNSSTRGTEGTLLERLDFTSTCFGKRLLLQSIASPLCHPQSIRERQDAVSELMVLESRLSPVRQKLRSLPDLEKLIARVHAVSLTKSVSDHPDSRAVLYEHLQYSKRKISDFIATISAFETIMSIQAHFCEFNFDKKINSPLLKTVTLCSEDFETGLFPNLEKLVNYFKNSFDHELARKIGKIVPEKGVDAEYDSSIDEIKEVERSLDVYLKEQCAIFGCKINYFGTGRNRFQLEIPESKCKNVPRTYNASSQRKGFRRYETNETKRLLADMTSAEERRDFALKNIMHRIFAQFDENYPLWSSAIDCVAQLDVLMSLSVFSRGVDGGPMVRPEITEITPGIEPHLLITEGRYPCKANTQSGEFISNTVTLGNPQSDGDTCKRVMILTGPNMGGKSTLMRQTALIVILAQMGCYVPAEGPVSMTPVDRLLTRQGASDSIHSGQSTLQVELNETAGILAYMSPHSFLLVDELGRGTSTHDGCAIACSILHCVADRGAPRTIFSTHFHRLLDDAELIDKLQMCHMACMVEDSTDSSRNAQNMQSITFLYKLAPGGCPKSYGFNVAKLANIPDNIILNGLRRSRLFEQETLILEFKRFLVRCKGGKKTSRDELVAWQQKFRILRTL